MFREMQPVVMVPGELLLRPDDSWKSEEFTNAEYINSKELRGSGSQSGEASASQEFLLSRYLGATDDASWHQLSQGEGENIKSGNRAQYSNLFQDRLTQTIEIFQRGIDQSQREALQTITQMTDSLDPLSGEKLETSLRELASKIKNANNGLADVSEFKKYQTGPHLNTAEGQATAEVDKTQIDISRRLLRMVDLYQQYQGQAAAGDADPVPRLKNQMLELKGQMKNLKYHIDKVQKEIQTWKTQPGEESQQMTKSRKALHGLLNAQLDQVKKQLDDVEKEYTNETHDELSLYKIKENLQKEKRNVQEQFTQIKEFPHMAKRSPSQKQDRLLPKLMVEAIRNLWR